MGKLLKLRSAPTLYLQNSLQIDREALVIRDVVAMQAGVEALGHGVQSDMKTLTMTKELADKHRYGVRQRFGHPGMSENAAGKKIAVGKNFRVVGDTLRHDMHLMDSASLSPAFPRDPLEYIFDMAERHPNELGESVVIEAQAAWTFADGTELPAGEEADRSTYPPGLVLDGNGRPVTALTLLPVIRPQAFYYVDVVSEGALTHDGLFEADMVAQMFSGTSSVFADEAFDLVDRWREEYGIELEQVPSKFNSILSKYLYSRGYREGTDMQKQKVRKFDDASGTASAPVAEAPIVEDEPTADPLDAALTQADATAVGLEEPLATPEPEATDDETTDADARIERLEAIVQAQQAAIDKLTRLSVANTANIETVNRNVNRMAGEPIVTERVPKTRPTQLEMLDRLAMGAQSFDAITPTPPASILDLPAPMHVSQRKPGAQPPVDFDKDPTGATLSRHLSRTRS